MKRKICCLVLVLSMIGVFLAPVVQADTDVSVWLNGAKLEFDVPPRIVDGRTLVPFRGILEALGAIVSYGEGVAYGVTPGKHLSIPIGEKYVKINFCTVETDVPAQIVDGRTLVPLRVVSECLGAGVSWDANTKTVTIYDEEDQYIQWNDNYYYWGDVADDGRTVEGYGTLYKVEDSSISCTGYFENNFILKGRDNGFKNNVYYVGDFSSTRFGYREGIGTMYHEDGTYTTAHWSNDAMNGLFYRYDGETGDIITGNAVDGEWHGEITLMCADGTTETRIYEYGQYVADDSTTVSPSVPVTGETTQSIPSAGGSSDIPYAFVTANYPLYLYSNDGKTFLGKLTTDKYDSESIADKYGDYGSKYSRTSIFNEYGDYGSNYDTESAFNENARKPPIIVDSDGEFIAYLTANKYINDGVSYVKLMRILEKYKQ